MNQVRKSTSRICSGGGAVVHVANLARDFQHQAGTFYVAWGVGCSGGWSRAIRCPRCSALTNWFAEQVVDDPRFNVQDKNEALSKRTKRSWTILTKRRITEATWPAASKDAHILARAQESSRGSSSAPSPDSREAVATPTKCCRNQPRCPR